MPKVSANKIQTLTDREPTLRWHDDCSDMSTRLVQSHVLDTYLQLAECATQAGDHSLAERMFHAAAAESTQLQSSWNNMSSQNWALAKLYISQNRYQRAEALLRQSVETAETLLGRNHYGVSAELERLAEVLIMKEDYAEAHKIYKRIIGLAHRKFGRRHIAMANILRNYAFVCSRQGKAHRAEFVLSAAARIEQAHRLANESAAAEQLSH